MDLCWIHGLSAGVDCGTDGLVQTDQAEAAIVALPAGLCEPILSMLSVHKRNPADLRSASFSPSTEIAHPMLREFLGDLVLFYHLVHFNVRASNERLMILRLPQRE